MRRIRDGPLDPTSAISGLLADMAIGTTQSAASPAPMSSLDSLDYDMARGSDDDAETSQLPVFGPMQTGWATGQGKGSTGRYNAMLGIMRTVATLFVAKGVCSTTCINNFLISYVL
jgi:hypothetical protein